MSDQETEALFHLNNEPIYAFGEDLGEGFDVVDTTLKDVDDQALVIKCSSLKLAARVMGVLPDSVPLDGTNPSETQIIESLQRVLSRVDELRQTATAAMGVSEDSKDYPAVFNAATYAILDLLAQENRLNASGRGDVSALSIKVMPKVMTYLVDAHPNQFCWRQAGKFEDALSRRLAVLRCAPRIIGLITYFDYYQRDKDEMQRVLWEAVVDEAERALDTIAKGDERPEGLIGQVYQLVCDLMCAVYRQVAYEDVSHLAHMSEIDRSLLITRYDQDGGKDYSHVLNAFRQKLMRLLSVYKSLIEGEEEDDESA